MSILLVLTAFSGHPLAASRPGIRTEAGRAPITLAIGLAWTCARLIRVLPERGAGRRALNQEVCSAGMAASMALMAALAL
ncbi:hypothetical protein ACFQX6_31775 [Streptosporangium lutulentum]